MPCTNTRAKHNLCAPKTCPDEKCPCAPATAFSCKPACADICLCDYLPREAFGRIIGFGQTGVSGIAGVALDTAVSNQGIDNVKVVAFPDSPSTPSLVQVNFKRGLFDRCSDDLPPVVSVLGCIDTTNGENSTFSSLLCTASTPESVIVSVSFEGDLDEPRSFDFRAVQAPRKTCH